MLSRRDKFCWEQTLHKEFLCRVFAMPSFKHLRWRASEIWSAHTRKHSGTWSVILDYVAERHGAVCDVCGSMCFDGGVWRDLPPFKGRFLCFFCRRRFSNFCIGHDLDESKEQSGIIWLAQNLAKGVKWVTKNYATELSNPTDLDDVLDQVVKRIVSKKKWKDGMPLGVLICSGCSLVTHDPSKLCDCSSHGHPVKFLGWALGDGVAQVLPSDDHRRGHARRYRRYYYKLIEFHYDQVKKIKANAELWRAFRFSKNWPMLALGRMPTRSHRTAWRESIASMLGVSWLVREMEAHGWNERPFQLAGWCDHYRVGGLCSVGKKFPDRSKCGKTPTLKCAAYVKDGIYPQSQFVRALRSQLRNGGRP